MFTIVQNPTFAHDIDVNVPVDGGYETQTLKVRYRVLDASELLGFDMGTAAGQAAFCERAVESFEDLNDQDGKPVTCNAKIKAALTGTPYVRGALMAHYTRALMGAQRKN